MRFGVFVPQGWRFDLVGIDPAQQWRTMADLARRFDESTLWESLWVYDHFHTTPQPSHEATHEAWTLMAAFAAMTDRIRLGQMCTCMSYRQPTYLAKVAATVDHVSGGRVEMGIGAGWYEHEWRAYGYGFPGAGERLTRLREGVEIFAQMWTRGEATLAGKHYQADGALCYPKPLQQGRHGIPLWVAGGGERKTLRIAAEYADYTNFGGDVETFRHKDQILRQHCTDLGRDPQEIVRSTNVNIVIGANDQEIDDRFAAMVDRFRRGGLAQDKLDAVAKQRSAIGVGTPEQIVEQLRPLKDAGMGYLIAYFAEAAYDTSGIELFEREVAPALAD
ncbi:LLM class F420-dependent oxidoreductase [Calidifontibacter sp. DB0510]|uniref:LLM class F420-dependent oxidoreductase n=1 Tax=Metallococcus carri TaxID=1656884 RepID=A0A967EG46_9MICO|nr:LLM class F420-dependent oxidoreductase [Metallococcus carri]NHN54618.1 LLM class F420-dependent oxidoreductase [Metallococcus carri]NOP36543.1 LLM class F420-dependent oxidoreductase [Calidifontibacter sp. DB2511S]